MKSPTIAIVVPLAVAAVAVGALGWWHTGGVWIDQDEVAARISGLDEAPPPGKVRVAPRPELGIPVMGPGKPSDIVGSWPWFRGPNLDAICDDGVRLARKWPEGGPERLWSIELGQGHASAAIDRGRVYVLDHEADDGVELLRGLREKERQRLAAVLTPLAEDTLDGVDPVLTELFPTSADGAAGTPRVVSAGEYELIRETLRNRFLEQREALLAALAYEPPEIDEQDEGQPPSLDDVDYSADVMRCLSLDDGREIWSNRYRTIVSVTHGRTRAVPAVIGDYVISLGPRCHVACWDANTGEGRWLIDMVLDYGATVPGWHAAQCPLIDVETDRLILAPSGRALMLAVDYRTGKVMWECPNPQGWVMSHVSIVPMQVGTQRTYVYYGMADKRGGGGRSGVAGVSADDGKILWQTNDWSVGTAASASPVVLPGNRLFFSGGYNSGALLLQVHQRGDNLSVETIHKLRPKEFSSEQHTPVFYDGYLYGVRQLDQRLVCLDLDGNEVWNSGDRKFDKGEGTGPYMIADGLLLVMDNFGVLTLVEATPRGYFPLDEAQVIDEAQHSWGPMALVDGRLIVRDISRMVCLDLRAGKE